jgi:beta-lactam-binding protein with PASTA domain
LLVIVATVSALITIGLAVHGHEVATPNLVGLTPSDAERAAVAAGLGFEVERRFYSANVPEGKIMSQVPSAGTLVRRGWRVRAAQSLGPQRIAIPNVIGQSTRVADISIRRRGLELGGPATAHLPDVPSDLVVAQSPPPNSSGVSAPKVSILATAPAEAPAFVMPNCIGQPLALVTEELQEAGLQVGSIITHAPVSSTAATATPAAQPPSPATPDQAAGTRATMIIGQDPQPGSKVFSGTAVNFEVVR